MDNMISQVEAYLRDLQDRICNELEAADGALNSAKRPGSARRGGGRSRVIKNGAVIEKGGVGFSHVEGAQLPPSATAQRPELAGRQWKAMGFHWSSTPKILRANVACKRPIFCG